MTKVAYNDCYGGWGISYKAYRWLIEHGMDKKYLCVPANEVTIAQYGYVGCNYDEEGNLLYVYDSKKYINHSDDELNKLVMIYTEIPRHHPLLIECIETLGSEEASGPCSKIEIDEITGDKYHIDDIHDGIEEVVEDGDAYHVYNVNEY
jgi:hypothetical protein